MNICSKTSPQGLLSGFFNNRKYVLMSIDQVIKLIRVLDARTHLMMPEFTANSPLIENAQARSKCKLKLKFKMREETNSSEIQINL